MKTISYQPHQLSKHDVESIAHLAGIGFGQGDTPDMLEDTVKHINAADSIVLAKEGETLAAFSMVREYLWR
jgi:hypothetical protein